MGSEQEFERGGVHRNCALQGAEVELEYLCSMTGTLTIGSIMGDFVFREVVGILLRV